MTLEGWQNLECACGSTSFHQIVMLKFRQGGGTTPESAGYVCIKCRAPVDTSTLIRAAKLRMKQAELTALQEELGVKGGANAQ